MSAEKGLTPGADEKYGDLNRFVCTTDKEALAFHYRIVKVKPYTDCNGNEHDERCYMTRLEDTAPHLDQTGTYGKHTGKRGYSRIFGQSSFEMQMAIVNSGLLPENEAEAVRKHQEIYNKWAFPCPKRNRQGEIIKNEVAYYGVRLIEGGPESVDKAVKSAEKKEKRSERKNGKDSKISVAFFSTDLNPAHLNGWTPDELSALELAVGAGSLYDAGDIEGYRAALRPLGEVIQGRLCASGFDCSDGNGDFHIALHWRDVYTIEDYVESGPQCTPGVKKYVHIHVVARCDDPKTQAKTREELGEAIGIAWNMIEPNRRGGHLFENRTAYLIHIKDRDKTPYCDDIVVTLAGLDYHELYEQCAAMWSRGAASKQKKELEDQVDWLREECATGRIVKDNILDSDELYKIYSCSKTATSEIDSALDSATQRRLRRSYVAIANHEFERLNIYIFGPSRTGKTQLALALAEGIVANFPGGGEPGWHLRRLAARNPLDEFDGSEVVLINEFRSQTFTEYQAALTFFDNNDCDPVGARYRNKTAGAQRVTLLTTPIPPIELFYFLPKGGSGQARYDSVDQAIARMSHVIQVIDPRPTGFYKYKLFHPSKAKEPYIMPIPFIDSEGEEKAKNITLRWHFVFNSSVDRPTPLDDLIETLVRDIDARCNSNRLTKSGAIDAAVLDIQQRFRERIAGAVAAGRLPEPQPLRPHQATTAGVEILEGGDRNTAGLGPDNRKLPSAPSTERNQ